MPRIRSIKPGVWLDEELASLPFEWRLLFIGLWGLADREGRLEDRPRAIKAQCLPYDAVDVDAGLGELARAGFVLRYEAGGRRLILVPGFKRHQIINSREPQSILPPPPDADMHVQFRAPDSDLHVHARARISRETDLGMHAREEGSGAGMEREGKEAEPCAREADSPDASPETLARSPDTESQNGGNIEAAWLWAIGDALGRATGKRVTVDDPLVGRLLSRASFSGRCHPAELLRWLSDTCERKREGGDAVRSAGFFESIFDIEFVPRALVKAADPNSPWPRVVEAVPCERCGSGRTRFSDGLRIGCACRFQVVPRLVGDSSRRPPKAGHHPREPARPEARRGEMARVTGEELNAILGKVDTG